MTLKELISTNSSICCALIDVRDYSQHGGYLIQEYHIGPYEDEDHIGKGFECEPRWKVIKTPINYKDIGKDYWGVFTKGIPNELLEMEVKNWQLWDGWSTNNGLHKHMKLVADLKGNDDAILIEESKPQIAKIEQLPGQMSIGEFIEVNDD